MLIFVRSPRLYHHFIVLEGNVSEDLSFFCGVGYITEYSLLGSNVSMLMSWLNHPSSKHAGLSNVRYDNANDFPSAYIHAIQNQTLSNTFLGVCAGHFSSAASSAALPVVISASAGWMKGDFLKIFQKPYKQKKIGMPM